jgi:CheY-like chemotaxis protein
MAAQILIVEDDTAHRQLFRYLFEQAGHAVEAVATGSAALAQLGQTTPDLIVCDLHLVGRDLDGYAITAWCRRQPHLATVPILCVTASFEVYNVEKVRACGFTTVIPKPIDPQTFLLQAEFYLPADKRGTPPQGYEGTLRCCAVAQGEAKTLIRRLASSGCFRDYAML